MRFHALLPACFLVAAACTASTSPAPVDEPLPAATTPTPTGSTTIAPPSQNTTTDGGTKPDAQPAIDKTPRFDLTLDGSPITITKVSVKVTPASGSGGSAQPELVAIDGSYEQQLNGPFTSTATFTIRVATSVKGLDTCGEGGRSADYWFKDTDGSLRGLGTSYQGGSCTMDVTANASDAFTAGTAKGTIGGVKTKTFTVRWGQPLSK